MATALGTGMMPHLLVKRVAVFTDFSENAAVALRYAAEFARLYQASLVLAHAYVPLQCAFSAPTANLVFEALDAERRHLKAELLKQTAAPFLRDISCSVSLKEGSPRAMVDELKNVDLVVVGTSGATGLEKAALGSTAETIFRSSSIPVLSVGPHCDTQETQGNGLRTVLYATDFSPRASAALPYAVSIAKQQGAHLALLHVTRDENAAGIGECSVDSTAALTALHSLVRENPDLNAPPSCFVRFGSAYMEILEAAKTPKAGVIVLGARGMGRFASTFSHLGGGTAYRVAANAECPVLMVPMN